MVWQQKGMIFKPAGDQAWSRSHAQVPSALVLADRIRVYYATRDDQGRSLTSFIDVDRADPGKILHVHDRPVMGLGAPGCHDEDGVMVGCVLAVGDAVYMYYTGWSRGGSVPYRVSCGLAISDDGGEHFTRRFDGPSDAKKVDIRNSIVSLATLKKRNSNAYLRRQSHKYKTQNMRDGGDHETTKVARGVSDIE